MARISASQIKQIKTLQAKIGMSDEDYRAALAAYDAESCVDLTSRQAADLVARLQRIAPKSDIPQTWRTRAQRECVSGRGDMATPSQINMIEAMWASVSRIGDRAARRIALDTWIHRRFHRGGLMMVEAELVHKLVRALTAMARQKEQTEVAHDRS